MTEIIPTIIINSKKLKECFEDNEKGDIHQILESERLSAIIKNIIIPVTSDIHILNSGLYSLIIKVIINPQKPTPII